MIRYVLWSFFVIKNYVKMINVFLNMSILKNF